MKFGWRAVLGIAISIAFLYYAFRNLDLSRALATARDANYWLLILSAAVATCMFPLRARRWRTILDPVAPKLPEDSCRIGTMSCSFLPFPGRRSARN